MTPKCSIIVTNYNYGCFLNQTIRSVLEQTMPDFELIVVDDRSEDDSRDIITRFSREDNRVRGIFNKTKLGQNGGFQEAVKQARGEIICCLDSDDWYLPNMLSDKLDMHQKHPDCALVDTDLSIDGETPMVHACNNFDYKDALINYGYLYAHNVTSGLSVRRDYILRCLPFTDTKEMWGGLDCILVSLALAGSDVAVDKRIGGRYRVHTNDGYAERADNRNGKFLDYYDRLRKYARKQVLGNGWWIPEDDDAWFRKIIDEQISKLHGRRIAIYGTSLVAKKVCAELEKRGENIVLATDRAETRRAAEEIYGLPYPYLAASLLHENREWDVVVIASRQIGLIWAFLRDSGIEEESIITLRL